MNLVPSKATYLPSESIEIEIGTSPEGEDRQYVVQLWHLDTLISESVSVGNKFVIEPPGFGGYGVKALDSTDGMKLVAETSFDVLNTPFERPRYGFVAEFNEGRNPEALVKTVRTLHLNPPIPCQ